MRHGPTMDAPATKNVKRLYLLTEPRFRRDLARDLLVLGAASAAAARLPSLRDPCLALYFRAVDAASAVAHRNAWWALLSLLSSSCCFLQVLLNVLGLGCAGFNTLLGPLRPSLLAVTVAIQAGSWAVAWSRPWHRWPTAAGTVLVCISSLLPEILMLFGGAAAGSEGAPGQQEELSATFFFKMTNVGCSSCVATVSRVLENISFVSDYKICLEKDQLMVTCKNDRERQQNKQIITKELVRAGFPME